MHAPGHWTTGQQQAAAGFELPASGQGGSSLNFFPRSLARAEQSIAHTRSPQTRTTTTNPFFRLSGVCCHHPSAHRPQTTSPCFDRIHGIVCRPFLSSFQLTPSSLVFFLPPCRPHCLARLIRFPRRGSRDQIFLAPSFPSPKTSFRCLA